MQEKSIQVSPVFKESFSLYKENFTLFFSVSLIGYFVILVEQFFRLALNKLGWFGLILSLLGNILLFWSYATLIWVVSKKYLRENIHIGQAFAQTWNKLWGFIIIATLYALVVVTGFLLLVIPGIYWGTIFTFVNTVFVLENTSTFEPFKRSKDLVQGNFWPIFGLGLLLLIILSPSWLIYKLNIGMTLKILLVCLTSSLSTPFGIVMNVNIYNRLKKFKGETGYWEGQAIKKEGSGLGCLAILGLIIAVIVLGSIWINIFKGSIKTKAAPESEVNGLLKAPSNPPVESNMNQQQSDESGINLKEFWAHNTRGNAFRNLEQYEEAIKEYKEMIAINPQHEISYNAIDWTYTLITRKRPLTPQEEEDRKHNLELIIRNVKK